jgi:hypothetical protein
MAAHWLTAVTAILPRLLVAIVSLQSAAIDGFGFLGASSDAFRRISSAAYPGESRKGSFIKGV